MGGDANTRIDFGPVPSQSKAENAVPTLSALLQCILQGISQNASLVAKTLHAILPSPGFRRLSDAFLWLQTDPAFKRVVVSLCCDKAVWDAVINKIVGQLNNLMSDSGVNESVKCNNEVEPDLGPCILKKILHITKPMMMELIKKFLSLFDDIFRFPERRSNMNNPTAGKSKNDQLEEKIQASLLLCLLNLLVVIVARFQEAWEFY